MPTVRRHRWFLLFWPVFVFRYLLLEGLIPAEKCHVVQAAMDRWIPFCEWFVIPYLGWYVFFIGLHLYTFRRDTAAFRRYSRFLIAAFSLSTVIFILFPSCQNLRPEAFPRENLLTDAMKLLYRMDTNTNVCPSEHVIGSVGFFLCARDSVCRGKPGRRVLFAGAAFLTSMTTVFLKQHSVVDVLAAIPVCAVAWSVSYRQKRRES